MSRDIELWRHHFPGLFREAFVEYADCRVRYTTGAPSDALVSRPHLPHPRAYWAYAVACVRAVGVPTNPPDGERVVEVLTLPLPAAADYLQEGDPTHADVLRHASALGLVQPLT